MFKVLVVDDDPGMRLLMQRVLARDYQVEAASGGAEALRLIQDAKDPFAVVVADLAMAKGSGMQLLAAAQHCAPTTTRILLSGNHRFGEDPEEAAGVDIFQFLLKPVNNNAVMAAVKAGVAHHVELCAA